MSDFSFTCERPCCANRCGASWRYVLTAALVVLLMAGDVMAGQRVQLAQDGQAKMSIVVGSQSSERVRTAARTLADMLGEITGGTFDILTQDQPGQHIIVGKPADFPTWQDDITFSQDILASEEILLRSESHRLLVLGASDLAVEHAVWTLLHEAGYRHYFPAKAWEIIPQSPDLSIEVDIRHRPSFYYRRIYYGGGMWDHNTRPYNIWSERNRASLEVSRASLPLQTAHAYASIYNANREAFEAHPEYLAMVDDERPRRPVSQKFCISNPGLRQLVIDYAVRTLKARPLQLSISMDPSDLAGHCECDACAKLGSVSDRVLLLANEVAQAINEQVENPLRVRKDWTREELQAIVAQGISQHDLLAFEEVSFSDTLVPARRLGLEIKTFAQIKPLGIPAIDSYTGLRQGSVNLLTWRDTPGELTFAIKTGVIFQNRGPVTIELTSPEDPAMGVIDSVTFPPDKQEHQVTLRTPFAGLHTITVHDDDGGYMLKIDPQKLPITRQHGGLGGIWDLYFYVPRGTRIIGGYTSHASGHVLGPDATSRFDFKQEMKGAGYFQIEVPPGEDGKLWKFSRVLGRRDLMTVPPYVARNADELLLPVEVVGRDAAAAAANQSPDTSANPAQ